MKWVKHDTDANQDAKLQNVLLDYGLEGYGLFWYCIELIAGKVDKDNITFELEHDARIIARNTGSTTQKVEEMMRYFVEQDLFQSAGGVITCYKLARRLDQSMTSNPEMRAIIEGLKNHDPIMTKSEIVMQDKIRLEEIRLEEKRLDKIKPTPSPSEKKKFSDDDMKLAQWCFDDIVRFLPSFKKPNLNTWANDIRLMVEIDKRTRREIAEIWRWCREDPVDNGYSENANVQSMSKLRKRFDNLSVKAKNVATGERSKVRHALRDIGNTDWWDS